MNEARNVELKGVGVASIKVSSTPGSLTQSVEAGPNREFRLIADEPVEFGGGNRGPNPYDLVLAALGTCMSLTMVLYARRKNWPLEKVEIELSHGRIHAADCEECETKEGKIDEIRTRTTLLGPLTQEQKERILSIGQRCPVHNTLTNEVIIKGL